MSDPVLPAAPGTYVISLMADDLLAWFPVIGWEKMLGRWEPVCFPPEAIRSDKPTCYLLPAENQAVNPNVYDPTARRTFEDLKDWQEFYEGEIPEKSPLGATFEIGTPVTFGSKIYKNKSFWHFKTTNAEFLFELDGNETCPDDPRVQKINRDEFFKARKLIHTIGLHEVLILARGDLTFPDQHFEGEDLI